MKINLLLVNVLSDSDTNNSWEPAVLVTDEVKQVGEGEWEESEYSEEEDIESPEDDGERVEAVEEPGQVVGLHGLPEVESSSHGADAAHQEVEVGAEVGGEGSQGEGGGQAGRRAEVGAEGEVEAVGHQDHGDDVGRHKEVLVQPDDAGGDAGPLHQFAVVAVVGREGDPLTELAVLHGDVVMSGQD